MKKWLVAMLFGSALVLGACGGDDGDDNGATSDTGNESGETASAVEDVYESSCAACHGADLSGGAGPNLAAIGADYSVDELKDIIANGTDGNMPAFSGKLSDDEIQQLADWLGAKK
ncbi:cytochrome c551 [Paucisalibacillus globulus]|uniref:cytochrome c551 n=1 Tax=Paucisalibacillus globulus TaxID=351095 RepID=UPI0004201CDF|nr:cytochrome c [Paucisalibacillus globulus]